MIMKLNNKGQALVEYLLIIGIVAVSLLSIVRLAGGYFTDYFTKSSCELLDKEYVEGEKPGDAICVSK